MTNTIPPHYSDRYVQQRYSKALRIVQHLSTSSFQPTKEQKLQLYAYYKQVSVGNVDTPRPGLFDMVGRAKWDAWKKLEGINALEAQYRYVDVFLQAVSEAYQKPASKVQAQQILKVFTVMGPTGDGDSTDEELTGNMDNLDNHVDERSSADEEEKAYLYEIQQNAGRSTPATMFRNTKASSPRQRRTSSVQSNHSPSLMRPKSTTTTTATDRPTSSASFDRRFSRTTSPFVHALPRDSTLFDDHLEDRIKQNPWAAHPATNARIPSLSEYNGQKRQDRSPTPQHHQRLPSSPAATAATTSANLLPPASPSPLPGSTASSSATVTRRQEISIADPSIISLGPATKRALESLQAEVIALNDRIDDLRNDVARRRHQQRIEPPPKRNDGRGMIKAALKQAVILTTLILLLVLHKRGYAILAHLCCYTTPFDRSTRTQRKLWLQRQSFLADDKNSLDHPANMKRLTKEMERVEREYKCLLIFQDPLLDSMKRIAGMPSPRQRHHQSLTSQSHHRQ